LGLAVTRSKYHDNIILQKLKSFEMGLQIPHCFHSEMQEKRAVWQDTEVPCPIVPRACQPTKLQNTGRAQNHVHMLVSIPPNYSVAEVVSYLKGQSAISVARQFSGRQRNFNGANL
jgi:Transposase IS200 like